MKYRTAWVVIFFVLLIQSPVIGQESKDVFDLAGVVRLMRAGVSDDIIALTIRNAKNITFKFDTSADGLIAMKQAGISDTVVRAIVERQGAAAGGSVATPLVPVPSGPIFAARQGGQMTPLAARQGKTAYLRSGAQSADELFRSVEAGKPVPEKGASKNPVRVLGRAIAASAYWEEGEPRTKTWKGFEVDYVSGESAEIALRGNVPIDFVVPFALLVTEGNPFAGRTLAPTLLKLRVLPVENIRVLTARQVELKPSGRKVLQVEKTEVPPSVERQETGFLVRVPALAAGEYALVLKNPKLSYFDVVNTIIDFKIGI